MSFRDPHAMLECLFYVNELPGGEAHHDGGMKGRDRAAVLANPMLQLTRRRDRPRSSACGSSRSASSSQTARPAKGTPNLVLSSADVAGIALPGTDKPVTARAGSEAAYVAVAKKYRVAVLLRVVRSQSVDASSARPRRSCRPAHAFEMSIQEQAATLMTDGLSFVSRSPAAQRVRDVRRVHGRHRARRLRDLALPAQPERRATKA